jgi:acetyltransferase-like isoleucine patch superfamily enzyme
MGATMIRTIASIIRSLRSRIAVARYDDFTVAEYLRQQGTRIGENCRIMIRSFGPEPYLIRIGNHCTIAPSVAFSTHDGGGWIFSDEMPSLQEFGRIDILDNCFIGMRAVVLPGVRIGPNSVVGAGAVVTKDVPPGMVVAGCPAVPICTIEEYRAKLIRSWEAQRPPGYLEDLQHGVKYSPAHIQRRKSESQSLLREHLERILK